VKSLLSRVLLAGNGVSINEIKTLSELIPSDECMMKHLAKLPIVVLAKETYGDDPKLNLMNSPE
jgi:hypothetical protein